MRSKVAALVGFCLVVGAVAGQGDGKGAKEIDGAWTFVSAVKGGKKKDFDGEPIRIVFKAGKMTIDKGGDTKNGSYKIDPAKKPKQIDLVFGEAKTAKGIYLFDGDTLKLCVQKEHDGERPTEFVSKEGTQHLLIVLKRKK